MSFCGLSPSAFFRLTFYEWGFYLLKFIDMQRHNDQEIEREKFFAGYLMAEMWNSAGKSLKKGNHVKPMDFWRTSDDTQADDIDLQELMNRPEIKYRFKKDG